MVRRVEGPILRRPEDIPIYMDECPVCGGDGGKTPTPLVGRGQRVQECPRCRGQGEIPRFLGGH